MDTTKADGNTSVSVKVADGIHAKGPLPDVPTVFSTRWTIAMYLMSIVFLTIIFSTFLLDVHTRSTPAELNKPATHTLIWPHKCSGGPFCYDPHRNDWKLYNDSLDKIPDHCGHAAKPKTKRRLR